MFGKNNKHMILKKGRKRVLKYSIKKLSVGVASVLVGVGLVFGATGIVNAQMGEGRLVNYSASGNTFQENPGYTKNYNFSDLQFNPKAITGDVLQGNTIDFEVYGKHNIAASTANWEIRLQLDERLAQYVEKIQVDPKKGVGNSRRTFVRINDSLGRPTNIWKVNYIRANDGLFAGAETTDTQTAPNGVITFEKNLDEIFKEIGADNLKSDRLMYRIYLVSHQDDDKIVPGIESAGYFLTDQDDFYNKLDVSENNSDQFKHGSVNTKYEEANIQTKDGSGSTGANGAIILDHKLTKEKNFSYSTSAKGTPWYANYKIDERLVPYVSGIQMHMVQADKVAYNVSFESGKKVADLAIERREGHENYGMGSITDNDLTKLIDFANASPRPIVVRYVLQLTKPLDEILEEMKAADKIEENAPFGEDFIFDSWLSDTNKKLIQNTYGTGYYYLQDIDGDGNPDDKEESGDTNPYIGKPELEEVYDVDTTVKGKVFIHELAGTDHKAQLVDKEGTVLAEKTIAPNEKDGAPISDTVEFEFTGVDSSKLIAKDELKIQIVSPGFDKPIDMLLSQNYDPEIYLFLYENKILEYVVNGNVQELSNMIFKLSNGVVPVVSGDNVRSEKNYSIVVFEKLAQAAINMGMDLINAYQSRDSFIRKNELCINLKEVLKVRDTAIVFYTSEIGKAKVRNLSPQISSIVQYIGLNMYTKITVRQIAQYFSMSEARLRTAFKKELNISIHNYILRRKISEAKVMLKSNYPINDISLLLGFSDTSHFTKVFKKITGTTPKKYQMSVDSKFTLNLD